MRFGRVYTLQLKTLARLAMLAVLSLAGCGSKQAEEARESARDAQAKAALEARTLADRGEELGNQAADVSKEALDRGRELSQSMLLKGKTLGECSIEEVHDFARELREEFGDDVNAAGTHVNGLLDQIARDPNEDFTTADKVGHMVVLMIPIVGPTKRYADARKLYEIGQAERDEVRMQEARREVLIACAEAGLDIGMLGLVGGNVDLVATGANKVLVALKLTRSASVLVGEDIKALDDLLDQLLDQEDVRSGVDSALTVDFAMVVSSN